MITHLNYNVIIMVKITHKDLASLLKISESYSRQLLFRKHIKLSNKYLPDIINLIIKRAANKDA